MTTREASKTAKESIPTKEKNNINARNVRFFQSLNSCSTDNTAKTLCCLPTTRRRGDDRLTTNGRGMRKWIRTAGSPGIGSRKIFQTSKKHLFKYINIYNRVYQRYTGSEKEKKKRETGMKYGWGELKKRNAGTEDYWSRRELQKLNAKEKNRSGNAKNGKCRNDIRTPRKNEEKYAEYRYKRKKNLYTAESMKISWKLWRIKISAIISSTIFYIFILLHIKTFISTNNQAETAFYAKEESRQES